MQTNKGQVRTPEIQLELMDWKQVEQNSETAVRKQMIDLEVTKNVRLLAKHKIVDLGGMPSEAEKEESIKQMKKQRAENEKNNITG